MQHAAAAVQVVAFKMAAVSCVRPTATNSRRHSTRIYSSTQELPVGKQCGLVSKKEGCNFRLFSFSFWLPIAVCCCCVPGTCIAPKAQAFRARFRRNVEAAMHHTQQPFSNEIWSLCVRVCVRVCVRLHDIGMWACHPEPNKLGDSTHCPL